MIEHPDPYIDQFIDYVPEPHVRLTADEIFPGRVSLYSGFSKDCAFEEERKWRICIYDLPDNRSVRFRTRKSMLVPYVLFPLGKELWPLISRIVVGPSAHQAETIAAIKMRLDERISVEPSVIPYRDW